MHGFRHKTGTRFTTPATQDLIDLLEKYSGAAPAMSNQQLNIGLKELFTELKITRPVRKESAPGGLHSTIMVPLNKVISSKIIGRNSTITRLTEAGIDPGTIAKIAGHTNHRQQDIYKDFTPDLQEKVKKALG